MKIHIFNVGNYWETNDISILSRHADNKLQNTTGNPKLETEHLAFFLVSILHIFIKV